MQSDFLALFGDVTISDILIFILGAGYIIPKLRQFYDWSRKYWQNTEKREKAIDDAGNLEKFHKQSVDIRSELQRQIKELREAVNGIIERLDKRDKDDREKRLNKTYNLIIQMFQFYTSEERNPMLAWTAMEADAFWKIVRDYEDDGGDGYVHTDIVPPMKQLKTIEMYDPEYQKLVQSRR